MIEDQGFNSVGELAIGEAVHGPVAECIEALSGSGLLHTRLEAAFGEGRDR